MCVAESESPFLWTVPAYSYRNTAMRSSRTSLALVDFMSSQKFGSMPGSVSARSTEPGLRGSRSRLPSGRRLAPLASLPLASARMRSGPSFPSCRPSPPWNHLRRHFLTSVGPAQSASCRGPRRHPARLIGVRIDTLTGEGELNCLSLPILGPSESFLVLPPGTQLVGLDHDRVSDGLEHVGIRANTTLGPFPFPSHRFALLALHHRAAQSASLFAITRTFSAK